MASSLFPVGLVRYFEHVVGKPSDSRYDVAVEVWRGGQAVRRCGSFPQSISDHASTITPKAHAWRMSAAYEEG